MVGTVESSDPGWKTSSVPQDGGEAQPYRRLLDNLKTPGNTIYSPTGPPGRGERHSGPCGTSRPRRPGPVALPGRYLPGQHREPLEGTDRQDALWSVWAGLADRCWPTSRGNGLLRIAVGFDVDPLIGTSIDGCPIYPVTEIEQRVAQQGARSRSWQYRRRWRSEFGRSPGAGGCAQHRGLHWSPLLVPRRSLRRPYDITSALNQPLFSAQPANRKKPPADSTGENGVDSEIDPIIRTIDTPLAGGSMKLEDLARKSAPEYDLARRS